MAFALALAAACGRPSAEPDPNACRATVPADECCPGADVIDMQNGWALCVCCTLGADAGWAFDLYRKDERGTAQCAQTRAGWETLCPSP